MRWGKGKWSQPRSQNQNLTCLSFLAPSPNSALWTDRNAKPIPFQQQKRHHFKDSTSLPAKALKPTSTHVSPTFLVDKPLAVLLWGIVRRTPRVTPPAGGNGSGGVRRSQPPAASRLPLGCPVQLTLHWSGSLSFDSSHSVG